MILKTQKYTKISHRLRINIEESPTIRKKFVFLANKLGCNQIMNKKKFNTYALLIAFCLLALLSFQTLGAQTLAEAKTMFGQGNYAQAKPIFEQYVRRIPSNGNYNLWYGACCLRTGDIDQAVRHLEIAVKKRIPSGQLWLGQAYDAAYRYEDAISTFEDYIIDLKRKRRPTQEADSLMSIFRTHLRMLKGVEKVCVIDSFVVNKNHFLQAYRLSSQAGRLFPYNEYFPMSDQQGYIVYENELGNKTFYDEVSPRGVLQLFTQTRLADQWSQGTPLTGYFSDSINTAYPFLMSDGVTLYYASEGVESLGGYDIFVTRYNTETDTYLRPENIGMPFNSPYNDYMYVVDEYANLGWFASDRYQPEGHVCIYVFIPNSIKEVYNYEQTEISKLRSLAALRSLRDTWTDSKQVTEAQTRLQQLGQASVPNSLKQPDFCFIIDDNHTYHQISDFRSPKALALFHQYKQIQKTQREQRAQLDKLRTSYIQATENERVHLAPAILDLEKRLILLEKDMDKLAKRVRKTEKEQK